MKDNIILFANGKPLGVAASITVTDTNGKSLTPPPKPMSYSFKCDSDIAANQVVESFFGNNCDVTITNSKGESTTVKGAIVEREAIAPQRYKLPRKLKKAVKRIQNGDLRPNKRFRKAVRIANHWNKRAYTFSFKKKL